MKFNLLDSDRRITASLSGGCFGCLGRTDSFQPAPAALVLVAKFNTGNGFSTRTSYSMSENGYMKTVPTYILLPRDFTGNNYLHLWHSSTAKPIVQYLVERSPYRSCFASTVQEIFKDEQVVLNAVGVPSEFVISCGFVLRELTIRPDHALTFNVLAELAPDVPEFIRFFLAMVRPHLFLGNTARGSCFGDSGRDGVIFPVAMNSKFFFDEDAYLDTDNGYLCPHDYATVQGYTMNVSKFWGKDSDIDVAYVLDTIGRKLNKKHTIEGVFGSIVYHGVHDVGAFAREFYNKLLEKR